MVGHMCLVFTLEQVGERICVHMTPPGNTQRSSSQRYHSLAVSGRHLFPGKSTTHVGTSVSFGEDQGHVRRTGAAAGFEGPLSTLSSPFSTLTPEFGMGVAEGSKVMREKEGQELEWDRAGVAPRDLEAVYDVNMFKALHCLS